MSNTQPKKHWAEKGFEIFCAVVFLGMIGLVFYNAFLRYVFHSSFAPSEEWSRYLFMYITFFGGVEAFYRRRHIAVDMFVEMMHGKLRRYVNLIALVLAIFAMCILFEGGLYHVLTTYDTYTVSTDLNMTLVNGPLPIMAFSAILILIRDLWHEWKRPLSDYAPKIKKDIPDTPDTSNSL